MPRRTKIVATLGPASSDVSIISKLITAGVDVFRLNFSHGTPKEHEKTAISIRTAAKETGKEVAILGDLQGPKIRIGKFINGSIELKTGASFILDTNCQIGNEERVGLDYPDLPNDVQKGSILLMDDGRLVLEVEESFSDQIHCIVRQGGILKNNKGINRQGGGLSAPALTLKDIEDIKLASKIDVDFLAISFAKEAIDIHLARQLLKNAGGNALLIAKIERVEAIAPHNLREILNASDGAMVARGDLAVEVGDAAVPGLQKTIIRTAQEMNKITIIATQMMESMIESPVPTRAEVSDVANAVLDGTDAVMLSAETATGAYPIATVECVHRVCVQAEAFEQLHLPVEKLGKRFTRIDESIAMAALFTSYHLNPRAIATLTHSGSTALWLSRHSCGVPIYALSPLEKSRRRMMLFRNVHPHAMESSPRNDKEELLATAQRILMKKGLIQVNDFLIMTLGDLVGLNNGTNTMKLVHVVAQ